MGHPVKSQLAKVNVCLHQDPVWTFWLARLMPRQWLMH